MKTVSAGKLRVDKTCFLAVAFPVYYISVPSQGTPENE
jgi:hypothetical protein